MLDMPIEINRNIVVNLNATREGAKTPAAQLHSRTPKDPTPGSSTSDTVSLTDMAAKLHRLQKTIAAMPVVDSQHVERIQKALNHGTFQINPAQVATKLMDFETSLNGVRAG